MSFYEIPICNHSVQTQTVHGKNQTKLYPVMFVIHVYPKHLFPSVIPHLQAASPSTQILNPRPGDALTPLIPRPPPSLHDRTMLSLPPELRIPTPRTSPNRRLIIPPRAPPTPHAGTRRPMPRRIRFLLRPLHMPPPNPKETPHKRTQNSSPITHHSHIHNPTRHPPRQPQTQKPCTRRDTDNESQGLDPHLPKRLPDPPGQKE